MKWGLPSSTHCETEFVHKISCKAGRKLQFKSVLSTPDPTASPTVIVDSLKQVPVCVGKIPVRQNILAEICMAANAKRLSHFGRRMVTDSECSWFCFLKTWYAAYLFVEGDVCHSNTPCHQHLRAVHEAVFQDHLLFSHTLQEIGGAAWLSKAGRQIATADDKLLLPFTFGLDLQNACKEHNDFLM